MAKTKKTKTITIRVLEEGQTLEEEGKSVSVPESFLQSVHKDALLPPKFPVCVRGTALCYHRGDPECPSFVVSTLNVMQLKAIREAG